MCIVHDPSNESKKNKVTLAVAIRHYSSCGTCFINQYHGDILKCNLEMKWVCKILKDKSHSKQLSIIKSLT